MSRGDLVATTTGRPARPVRTCRTPRERSADMNALGQLIGVLFVVGLVIRYFWWLAALAAVVMAAKWAPSLWARHQAAVEAWKAEQHAIANRADQQHAWVLAGDPRGTYGAEVAVATKGNRTAA